MWSKIVIAALGTLAASVWLGLNALLPVDLSAPASPVRFRPAAAEAIQVTPVYTTYLPLLHKNYPTFSNQRTVNTPFFDVPNVTETKFAEMAIFWLGRVTPAENYTDVRVGYNNTSLYIYLAVIDRRIWFDLTPSISDLEKWDGATLYFDLNANGTDAPTPSAYRFGVQYGSNNESPGYRVAYRGRDSGWVQTSAAFSATTVYRGEGGPNSGQDDRGWALTYVIPFASLGLTKPAEGTVWRLALALHDRDDQAGMLIADKTWPEALEINRPVTWGRLRFGLPAYTPPLSTPGGTVTIKQGKNSVTTPDGDVGGYTNCGSGQDFWTEWGERVYYQIPNSSEEYGDFNVQNQSDIADWPCFAKYYITLPLDTLPAGKVIRSATFTLHHWSNPAGMRSLIKVLTVAENWNEAALNWNNAPLALENVSQAWVDPLPPGSTNFPGVPITFDVSRAVAQAYAGGQPLRLAVYSADSDYHSGKYFISSDTGDWNEAGRPALEVSWGNP